MLLATDLNVQCFSKLKIVAPSNIREQKGRIICVTMGYVLKTNRKCIRSSGWRGMLVEEWLGGSLPRYHVIAHPLHAHRDGRAVSSK